MTSAKDRSSGDKELAIPRKPHIGPLPPLYTVAEVAQMFRMSQTTVLRMFKLEPGVLMFGNTRSRKRTKITLRIPEDVLLRVYARIKSPDNHAA
jgi:AraC-like DNA-binding protein